MNAATQATVVVDDAVMPAPWTEDHVLAALYRHFTAQGWACVAQVALQDDEEITGDTALLRRIDMLCVRRDKRFPTGGTYALETLAIEVKTSRQDFLNDIRNPDKQATWREYATRHAYATPEGLVQASEVPEGHGFITVERLVPSRADSTTSAQWVRRAPYRDNHMPSLPPRILTRLIWRAANAEAQGRGWNDRKAPTDNLFEMRQRLRAAEKDIERLERNVENAQGKAEAWRAAYAVAAEDGLPCRWCERPLRPLKPGVGWFREWRHVDKADDAPCRLLEEQHRITEAHRKYNTTTPEERDRAVARQQPLWEGRPGFWDLNVEPWRVYFNTLASQPEPDTA